MVHLIVQASKYIMILLFMIYTYECFHVFRFNDDEERQNHIYHVQRILLFTIHFDAFLVLYLTSEDKQMIAFYRYWVQSSSRIICFTNMRRNLC